MRKREMNCSEYRQESTMVTGVFSQIKPIDGSSNYFRTGHASLFALHGPNFSTELSMLDTLENLDEAKLPLLKFLYGQTQMIPSVNALHSRISLNGSSGRYHFSRSPFQIHISREQLDFIANEIAAFYGLNEDQIRVLNQCKAWFQPMAMPIDANSEDALAITGAGGDASQTEQSNIPIILVHGVFGSGKSTLLVILILFLSRVLDIANNRDCRILVCAATNTAVDRVLLGLLKEKFCAFVRVGSLKKIAKPILNYTLQSSEDKEAIKELQSMLQEEQYLGESDRRDIKRNLEAIKTGEMRKREKRLKEVRVVGVTCVASLFPVLDDNCFPIVFLDEAR